MRIGHRVTIATYGLVAERREATLRASATLKVQTPEGHDDLAEFLLFQDRVYEYRAARWPVILPLLLPVLTGESPFAEGRTIRPFLVREGGEILARALAVVDDHYNRHWHERLGHITMFEAMPDTREAVKMLMDQACEWLRSRGVEAARAGFGLLDFPFAIDDYESLPPSLVRQNPAYYHCLLKGSGFESEQGWVDYKIRVTPELIARYESALEAARRAGYDIVPLSDIPEARRVSHATDTFNDTFKTHWGFTPFTEAELSLMLGFYSAVGGLETSAIAYRDDAPVAIVLVTPDSSEGAVLKPGRKLSDAEKLNFLGIGVRESARGRGVNLAIAAYTYLELIRRGAKYLSYTLVLDDNWPSRRTAEKLGAYVCANYMVYRRNFRR
jgi:GNAT superfamily N-acetyltransferase